MPIEYGVMGMILGLILAGGAYGYWIARRRPTRPSDEFEREVIAHLRRARETGESIVLEERGWPTVEIRPGHPGPPPQLRGSVTRYDRPTDPIDED